MADSLFDIIFRGDIVAGQDISEVKGRLVQLFKADLAKIEALFSGGAVPLKRNLDQATAEKYQAVLLKAGARVQLRPASTGGQVSKAPPPEHRAGAGKPAPAPTNTSRPARQPPALTLAPAGSDLLKPEERKRQQEAITVDFSGISLRPLEGDLLDASEKRQTIPLEIDTADFDLAEVGTDLLDGYRNESLPLPELDPEFDLAEPGADLLEASYRKSVKAVEIDLTSLDILPLESD